MDIFLLIVYERKEEHLFWTVSICILYTHTKSVDILNGSISDITPFFVDTVCVYGTHLI